MSRFALGLIAAALVALPAEAAVSSKSERGVRVWRGAPAAASIAAPSLKGGDEPACSTVVTVNVSASFRPRRLITHKIRRNEAFDWEKRLPYTTQGFFADRIAAGY